METRMARRTPESYWLERHANLPSDTHPDRCGRRIGRQCDILRWRGRYGDRWAERDALPRGGCAARRASAPCPSPWVRPATMAPTVTRASATPGAARLHRPARRGRRCAGRARWPLLERARVPPWCAQPPLLDSVPSAGHFVSTVWQLAGSSAGCDVPGSLVESALAHVTPCMACSV